MAFIFQSKENSKEQQIAIKVGIQLQIKSQISFINQFHQMGKRAGHRNNKNNKGHKKVHQQWNANSIPEDNDVFREFYKVQLGLPEQEFKVFWATMKQKLPVVFRVNPTYPNYRSFCEKLNNQKFIREIVKFDEFTKEEIKTELKEHHEPKEMPKLETINWYPGGITYTINTNKQQFKKSKILSQLHKYLQKSFDSGLISRQQLVSMLPPLYLQIQPDDMVLDMCAAPGSKTSQMLEMIYQKGKTLGNGCVIANDADYSRAQMLIHQINRSGTAGVAVINHPGQFLPQLYFDKINHIKNKFQFDKILCDVPCSGDGATRKIPIKWAKWHTSDGNVLHPLQLSILMKSINLLKRGGLIVYSTCSLNPVQDQAVLYALFQKVTKGLQIIDIHQMYGVKGRRGLLGWKVCGLTQLEEKDQKGQHKRQLKFYDKYEDAKSSQIKQSLFPPATEQQAKKIGLQNTMRIIPHDQNSGGFFVALLKKHDDFEWKYDVKNEKRQQDNDDEQEKFVAQNLPQTDKHVVLDNQDPKPRNQNQENQEQSDEDQDKVQQNVEKMEIEEKFEYKNQPTQGNQIKDKNKVKSSKYESFSNINEQEFEALKKFYGLSDDLKKLLYVRDTAGTQRKVVLVSEGVRKFLEADKFNKIKLVNMGCRVFEKGKESFSGHECLYRLSQEGIHYILQLMQKRKIKVPVQFFKKILSIHSMTHDEIDSIEVRQKIRAMTQGSFTLYIDEQINGERVVDAIVGQNFKNSLHLMVSKEDVASLNIRYL